MNIIEQIEKENIAKLTAERPVPEFRPGDTLRVNYKVVEGTRERIQAYEGVCIGRKSAGMSSSFTVRKISSGEGVERVFPLYSPNIASIDVVRMGRVRRSKLYYLRERRGKSARITERSRASRNAMAAKAEARAAAAATLGDAAAPAATTPEQD